MTTTTASPADHSRRADLAGLASAPPPDDPGAPVVHWPDPSGLERWWTEVMDGALTPIPASTSAPVPPPAA